MNNNISNTTRNFVWGSSQNPAIVIIWNSITIRLWNTVGHFIQTRTIHSARNIMGQYTIDYFKEND